MHKDFLADISTGFVLITSGPLLLLNSTTLGLETALGIFYMFFGFSVSRISCKEIFAIPRLTEAAYSEPVSSLNIKTRLAQEKAHYHRVSMEQAKRRARICQLEDSLANENPNPYRASAN